MRPRLVTAGRRQRLWDLGDPLVPLALDLQDDRQHLVRVRPSSDLHRTVHDEATPLQVALQVTFDVVGEVGVHP